ncbi:MAG TPA: type II secretion system protein [Planctomycetota bacterium]|nr:type II secretion system protein [Planctomycetota bacterium]
MRRRGFTLIEVLVVMTIIAMLAAALVTIINGVIERQKCDKTAAMIMALGSGCETYHSKFKEYPPTAPYTGSQNLHYYLASAFDVLETVDPPTRKRMKPILPDFRHDWIQGAPSSNDPATIGVRYVIDAWGITVTYQRPGPGNLGFLIRSNGPDKVSGGGDDIDNEKPEF